VASTSSLALSRGSSSRTTVCAASSSTRDALFNVRLSSFARGWCPTATYGQRSAPRTDDTGWIIADTVGRTSVAGVYVAGNAVNPRAQVITAAGEGSAAAIAINADLVNEDDAAAVYSSTLGQPARGSPEDQEGCT
jgi:thioredoxin reductase